MNPRQPLTDTDVRFGSPNARRVPWTEAKIMLAAAEIYWITTVRTNSRPHVTPLMGVWADEAMHICTGVDEQKHRNLSANPYCILTTGCNRYGTGLDLVLEGLATPVEDEKRLHGLSDAWVAKYGEEWRFEVANQAFWNSHGGRADVFRVAPSKVLGFSRGTLPSQTRWRFDTATKAQV